MTDLPSAIACSLPPDQWPRRARALAVIFDNARSVREEYGGLTLEFEYSPERARALLELVMAERECCRFMSFRLDLGAELDGLRLHVRGSAGEAALEAWLRVIQPASEEPVIRG
jgi:hypothetical protein